MDDNTLPITGHSLRVGFQFPGCVISNQIKSKAFGLAVIAGLTKVRLTRVQKPNHCLLILQKHPQGEGENQVDYVEESEERWGKRKKAVV